VRTFIYQQYSSLKKTLLSNREINRQFDAIRERLKGLEYKAGSPREFYDAKKFAKGKYDPMSWNIEIWIHDKDQNKQIALLIYKPAKKLAVPNSGSDEEIVSETEPKKKEKLYKAWIGIVQKGEFVDEVPLEFYITGHERAEKIIEMIGQPSIRPEGMPGTSCGLQDLAS
jgi:hypothetical protein